jgi:hypothetical protein
LGADFIGNSEVNSVGEGPTRACSDAQRASLTELVAACVVAAELKLVNASHSIAAYLEVGVDALPQTGLCFVRTRSRGVVDVHVAQASGVCGSWEQLLAALLVRTAVSIGSTWTWHVDTLDTINAAALLAARVVKIARIATLHRHLVVTLSPWVHQGNLRILCFGATGVGGTGCRNLRVAHVVYQRSLARTEVVQVRNEGRRGCQHGAGVSVTRVSSCSCVCSSRGPVTELISCVKRATVAAFFPEARERFPKTSDGSEVSRGISCTL